jgi:YHS domain-containing protein
MNEQKEVIMKYMKTLILAMLIAILAVGYVLAEETVTPKPQTTCPVMGGKIDKTVFADHGGKMVYFCCKGCIPEFQKDPAKYIKKLENEGITLEKAPRTGFNKESSPGTNVSGKQSNACGGCGCDS